MSRSHRELKAIRDAQREEQHRRERARDRRNLILIAGGVVVAGLAILLIAVALNRGSAAAHHLAFVVQSGSAGDAVPDEGRTHIDPSTTATYKVYPPTSGPHYPQPTAPVDWQTIGDLSEGIYLHNLEHGGIAILYNCSSGSACDTLKGQLTNYVQNLVPQDPLFHEYKIIMTPYHRSMLHPVAVLAWNRLLWLDGYDQAAITRFYELYVDQAPERIP